MRTFIGNICIAALTTSAVTTSVHAQVQFERDVWPILAQRCIECHGEAKQEGDLRLDSPEHIRAGGQFGEVLAPGSIEDSALYELIALPDDDKDAMPGRGDRLASDQIETIKNWILEGASFDGWTPALQQTANAEVARKNTVDFPHTDELPTAPISFNKDIRNILSNNCSTCHGPDAGTREAGLRLDAFEFATKDLGGRQAVKPGSFTESEIIKRLFHADPGQRMPPASETRQPTKSERLLLAAWIQQGAEYEAHWAYEPPKKQSPQTSDEANWARNEIDDYILASLKHANVTPAPEADRTTLIRRLHFDLTGLPPTPQEVNAFKKDKRADAYERLVDTLLASPHFGERLAIYWLDLVRYADTAGYHGDQIRGSSGYRDYVINAFNTNMPFDQFTREQLAGDLIENATLDQKLASGYNRLNMVTREGGAQEGDYIVRYAADRVRTTASVWLGSSMGCAECHDHKFDPFTMKDFYSFGAFFADIKEDGVQDTGGNSAPFPPLIPLPTDEQRNELDAINAKLNAGSFKNKNEKESLKRKKSRLEKKIRTSVVTETAPPRMMRILARGNWQDESGEIVQPAIPEFLGLIDTDRDRATRMDLANWLTSRDNPLTARVFVNRLWKLYFGTGISKVLDDVGAQGEWPKHPELLDYLAIEFMDHNWDIKHIVKQMVTSAAYRQASLNKDMEQDPLNRLHGRQSRIRHDAEIVRDNALKVSGLLVTDIGGRSVMPYQPAGYYKELNFPTRTYPVDSGENLYRRGVYTHWQRTYLHPSLLAFDAPTREECTAERPVSNSPQQALALLNDPIFVEAARTFAERILNEGGRSTAKRIEFAFNEALSRNPTKEESDILSTLFQHHKTQFEKDPEAASEFLTVGKRSIPENLDPVKLAAWSSVARTVLNLHETLYRY